MTVRAYLDKSPSLGEGVYVDPTALVIGDVTHGAQASVWPMTVIRGDVNWIQVGAGLGLAGAAAAGAPTCARAVRGTLYAG